MGRNSKYILGNTNRNILFIVMEVLFSLVILSKGMIKILAEVLKELLHVFPNLAMTADLTNSTALHTAATQGHIDIVNLLLETDSNHVKIAISNGKTVLHSAARILGQICYHLSNS